MLKKLQILVVLSVVFLCGCSATVEEENEGTDAVKAVGQETRTEAVAQNNGTKTEEGGLTMANPTGEMQHCNTEDGYYYFTESSEELKDGNYGYHLMYVDFATRQEIYLCSNAECSHDTLDCSAVFDAEEFGNSSCLFIYNSRLFLLSRDYDMDGSMAMEYIGDSNAAPVENKCAALYAMELDGSHREKVYSFDGKYTVEDRILMDDQGIYMVEKILDTKHHQSSSYTTSSASTLVCIDVDAGTAKEVCSLDIQDGIRRNIIGCYGEYLVFSGTKYDRELSLEEEFDDDKWRDAYLNSETIYELLSVNTGEQKTVISIPNKEIHSSIIKNDKLYVGIEGQGNIQEIDLMTGEQKKLADVKCNDISYVTEEALCCCEYGGDGTLYFVRLDTGEVSHCGLLNKSLGWPLDLLCEAGDSMLVFYDYDATPAVDGGDGAYEIHQYKMALIRKADLFQGTDAFMPIQMVSSGQ